MTFSKSKIVAMWVCLFVALGVAVVALIVGGSNETLGNTISMAALGLAVLAVLLGFLFVRCPACGKVLVRVMRPWKSGCTCPSCHTKIKFM